MADKTSLTLTNFPPCGFVKLNNEVVNGLEGEVSETVTVIIPNIPNGNHSLEVDSGLGMGIRKYNDIVICKDGSEKTIDLSRFFCTLCIEGYDVNYKLYIDNMPAKYYVSNDSIVTGVAVGKHNLLFKNRDNEFERDVEIKQGFNKISFEKKTENKEVGDELIDENDKLSKEELSRMVMELGKVSSVKVSKNGVRIIRNEPEKTERPKRDVFIPPPLPRIKAKRVESIDGNISIPAPMIEDKKETRKDSVTNVTKNTVLNNVNNKTENSGEARANNVVDLNSVRQERVENNTNTVEDESSIAGKIGLGGALAAGLYFLFKK